MCDPSLREVEKEAKLRSEAETATEQGAQQCDIAPVLFPPAKSWNYLTALAAHLINVIGRRMRRAQ